MGLLLDMSPKIIRRSYLFCFLCGCSIQVQLIREKSLLSEAEFREYYDKYPGQFVKMGAEGIKDLLEEIDLDEELKALRDELESATDKD